MSEVDTSKEAVERAAHDADWSTQAPRTVGEARLGRRRTLGRNVKRLMDQRGMTYAGAAKAFGLRSKSGVHKIVRGEVDARVSTLWSIADFFGVDIPSLFDAGCSGSNRISDLERQLQDANELVAGVDGADLADKVAALLTLPRAQDVAAIEAAEARAEAAERALKIASENVANMWRLYDDEHERNDRLREVLQRVVDSHDLETAHYGAQPPCKCQGCAEARDLLAAGATKKSEDVWSDMESLVGSIEGPPDLSVVGSGAARNDPPSGSGLENWNRFFDECRKVKRDWPEMQSYGVDRLLHILPIMLEKLGLALVRGAAVSPDEGELRCTCNWRSPENGRVLFRWPAVLMAGCPVHFDSNCPAEPDWLAPSAEPDYGEYAQNVTYTVADIWKAYEAGAREAANIALQFGSVPADVTQRGGEA